MYASLDIAREAVCEKHRQAEAQRPYRQLVSARRMERKAGKAALRAHLAR